MFDKSTAKWFKNHPDAETTVAQCNVCKKFYKPSLGHECTAHRYAWSLRPDDDIWHGGPCASIEECIQEALFEGYEPGTKIAVGYIEPYVVKDMNIDVFIERLQMDACEEVGEVAEDWLSSITKKQISELESEIEKVVLKWLKDIDEVPSFYKVLPLKDMVELRKDTGKEN